MGEVETLAAFLGVERSLTGRRWRERPAASELTRAHQARLGLSQPLARALAARNVPLAGGEVFLRPSLRDQFPDPSVFTGMDLAASILVDALQAGGKVVVFADYDVDGAASAAQIVRWFRAMGREAAIYVPDRMTEGYGPTAAAFRQLKSDGADLVITVDCGAAAHDALAEAGAIGLQVVVIDHHLMRDVPEGAAAIVNPNRPDCASGQGGLAAAGVSFVLLAALNREARRRGLFAEQPEPDLRRWLDLAALGAICDVTQLVGFNRALVAQGLKVMSGWKNPGLAALMAAAGAPGGAAGVFEAGFILGPRINAGGRIGRSDLGARLLATDDAQEAADLASRLDALNVERREVERQIVAAAIDQIERSSNFDPNASAIVVAQEGWHPGVVGIVASRLRERYRRPAVVIGVDRASNVGRGSGRSQPGVNLGRAIQEAFEAGLLLAGGGHAMAAGLTLRPEVIPEFRAFLAQRLAAEMDAAANDDWVDIDALVAPAAAAALRTDFQRLAPFGPGNPEPLVGLADVRVERASSMRGGHMRCALLDAGGASLNAVAWRIADTAIGRRLMAGGGALHVTGRLRADDWQGRSGIRLEIEDAADPRLAPSR